MKTRKLLAPTAVLMATALLAACSGGSDAGDGGDGGSGEGGDVTLTFWHNSTTGPGKEYWDETAAQFEEANPGVTVEIQSIQNEDMDGKLQTALNSGDAPDIFMARGGGKLADIVEAGQAALPPRAMGATPLSLSFATASSSSAMVSGVPSMPASSNIVVL